MSGVLSQQGKRDSNHKPFIYRDYSFYVPNRMPNTQKYAHFNARSVRKAEAIPPADQVQYTGKSTGCSFAELLAEHIHNRCGIWLEGLQISFTKSKSVLSIMSYGNTFFSSADSIISFLHII